MKVMDESEGAIGGEGQISVSGEGDNAAMKQQVKKLSEDTAKSMNEVYKKSKKGYFNPGVIIKNLSSRFTQPPQQHHRMRNHYIILCRTHCNFIIFRQSPKMI